MSLLDAQLREGRQWTRVGDGYEVTKKPRTLDRSTFQSIPFAAMEAIPQDGTYLPVFQMRAPNEIASGTYFERGDVLVGKITPSFENGKQALVHDLSAPFGYATTEVIPLHRRSDQHDPRFLFFYLLHPDIRHFVAVRMEGSTGRQRVPENVLLDLFIPDFGRDDQSAVADVLETIQKASSTEANCERLARDLKRAAMRELFTRGLKGEVQKATENGLTPESWKPTRCELIFKLTSGKTRPDDLETSPSVAKPYAVLGGNGVMGYSASWNVEAPELLVIGRVGEYCGAVHLASGKVWITDNALYAKEWLLPAARLGFVGKFLEHFDLNRFKRTAGQPLVTQGMINEHSIPLPSPEEQDKIVLILDAIDRKINLHMKKRAVLDELFKALLHKLITGEIRIADLDLSALHQSVTKEAA